MRHLFLLLLLIPSFVFAEQPTSVDSKVLHAIKVIKGSYGDDVSVSRKQKSLLKYGRNEGVGTSAATIMDLAGSEVAETYVAGNLITHIASASTDDTTQTITVEGHTISGGNLTFSTQTVAIAGRTKTALTTPIARATRAYVSSGSTDLTGPVYIAQDVTFTNGVPQTDSAVHLIIPAGRNQTRKASTSLSSQDYWIVTQFYCDVLEKTTTTFATTELEVRELGGVFLGQAQVSCSDSHRGPFTFDPYLVIPKNSDVRLQATASTSGVDVSGGIQGYLAVIE